MMKRRMKKLNNKGYSLIELIIVVAIIAIFTAAAMVTLSTMHSAKAKEAAITFESELSELLTKCKSNSIDPDLDGVIDSDDKLHTYGLRIHSVNGKCYLQEVIVKDGLYLSDASYENAKNNNGGKGISLSSYVYVRYTDFDGNQIEIKGNSANYGLISYNRDGSCSTGYGTYEFIRESSDTKVATITINKNGSFQSK